MEKNKIKSILPKPSPSIGGQTPSPTLTGNKRKSLTSTPVSDFNIAKKQRSRSTVQPPPPKKLVKREDDDAQSVCSDQSMDRNSKQTGHRPVTSCTFCRQHKIKCNASDNYPRPCQRCERMGLKCEIDPQFRPKKGSQIQSLKSDVDELKAKIEMLTKNESLLTQALNQHNLNFLQQQQTSQPAIFGNQSQQQQQLYNTTPIQRPVGLVSGYSTNGQNTPTQLQLDYRLSPNGNMLPVSSVPPHHVGMLNDSMPPHANPAITHVLQHESSDNSPATINERLHDNNDNNEKAAADHVEYAPISDFVLGDVSLPLSKANELHDRFMSKFLPFLPIISSRLATELYHKSQLLFWSVILTAALLEPEPTLYMSLASLIKQLAIETCWIRTPRSTHVIQALIILSIWPLPNEKVLDDCSYRFIGLAKNLSLQLGLHRGGEFILEFSRTQVSLGPDAELWRTRSWLAVFFCEQFWSSVLGLPPSINTTDYLLENARVDNSLPKNFRCLISLSIFQCKLVNVMGISVTRSDGLLEPSNRAGSLNILDRELERLRFKLPIDEGSVIDVYYLYIKLMICCFAFLPGTPIEDQVKYVSSAYLTATKIVTLTSQMISSNTIMLIELPIYVRQAITYSVLLLFKLHLSRYLIDKYVDSARQSIVTVHRLLRNTISSWKDLQNDISRTAKVLENLNIVLYTYPEIFTAEDDPETDDEAKMIGGGSIITRMRSHLTASLFYDLVWCVHEARRRTLVDKSNGHASPKEAPREGDRKRPAPLPFYNQITKDDFKTITTTTPNGTTITTLVPTDQAMNQARSQANANGLNKPLEINGIPLAMLEATGSIRDMKKETPVVPVREEPPIYQNVESFDAPPPSSIYVNGKVVDSGSPNFSYGVNTSAPESGVQDQMDNFFQQQSNGWLNNDNYQDDDFLGWFDVNMIREK